MRISLLKMKHTPSSPTLFRPPVTDSEADHFGGYMMLFFGRLDAKKGWTKQLHLGAYRNVNLSMLQSLGRDTGFDSIGDWRTCRRLRLPRPSGA